MYGSNVMYGGDGDDDISCSKINWLSITCAILLLVACILAFFLRPKIWSCGSSCPTTEGFENSRRKKINQKRFINMY